MNYTEVLNKLRGLIIKEFELSTLVAYCRGEEKLFYQRQLTRIEVQIKATRIILRKL